MEVPCEDKLPAILDPDSASALCQCQPGTIEDALRAGKLPGVKIGAGWIIPTRAFIDELNDLALDEMHRRREPKKPRAVRFVKETTVGVPGGTPLRRSAPNLEGLQ